jgi:hypothetical protein
VSQFIYSSNDVRLRLSYIHFLLDRHLSFIDCDYLGPDQLGVALAAGLSVGPTYFPSIKWVHIEIERKPNCEIAAWLSSVGFSDTSLNEPVGVKRTDRIAFLLGPARFVNVRGKGREAGSDHSTLVSRSLRPIPTGSQGKTATLLGLCRFEKTRLWCWAPSYTGITERSIVRLVCLKTPHPHFTTTPNLNRTQIQIPYQLRRTQLQTHLNQTQIPTPYPTTPNPLPILPT